MSEILKQLEELRYRQEPIYSRTEANIHRDFLALEARIAELESAAREVIDDSKKRVYLMGHDTSPAIIKLAALVGVAIE